MQTTQPSCYNVWICKTPWKFIWGILKWCRTTALSFWTPFKVFLWGWSCFSLTFSPCTWTLSDKRLVLLTSCCFFFVTLMCESLKQKTHPTQRCGWKQTLCQPVTKTKLMSLCVKISWTFTTSHCIISVSVSGLHWLILHGGEGGNRDWQLSSFTTTDRNRLHNTDLISCLILPSPK